MSLSGDTIQAGQDLKDFIETETEGAIEGTLNGLKSIDQRFRFVILLNTGNVVLIASFQFGRNQTLWASNTTAGVGCRMQADGNLVIYDQSNNVLWASGTNGHPGAHGIMQSDGNFVIYDSGNNPLWATGTNVASPVDHAVKPAHGRQSEKPRHGKHDEKPSHGEHEVKPAGKH